MSDSRKAWGYDKLIELLEQHKQVAEKEEEDDGNIDSDR